MPRRNRRRDDDAPQPLRFAGVTQPLAAPPGWTAQRYTGVDADRVYTCPRCHREVGRRTEHVVAWRTGGEDHRRHWHSACWTAAVREGIERYRFT